MNYKISYKNPTSQYIPIEAEFDCGNDSELELQFPAWRPGRYELGNFAKNVKGFLVSDENNKKVPFEKIGKDSWKVDCSSSSKIIVTYFYFAAELNAGSSFMDDLQLYVNPVNCLVYILNRQDTPCTVKLEIPQNFEIATGAKHEDNTLYCASYHELVDSPFIASASLVHKTYTILGIHFHIWVQGQVSLDWEKIIADFEKFTKKQLEKFSNKRKKKVGFPVKEYHFLYQILPIKSYHGVEHTTSTVISLGPAEQIMTDLYDDFLGVSSHELYHTWNVKTIRPKDMFPYDYSKENFSNLGYVAEGVTTYLGDLFLAEAQVKDFAWYKKELEKLLQKHFDNFGRFNYSVAKSSWDTWLDGYVKGAPARKVSIYNEGALLAFIMDMKIRENSLNKASLHDVMLHLYTNFAEKGIGYTENDYKNACELFAKESLDDFFKNYVHGAQPYESNLVKALETIGFTLEMTENESHGQRILGIKTILIDQKTIVTDIYPGSSAELGAVMIGDQILTVNEIAINNDLDKALEPFQEIPLAISVNRMGRQVNIICPNTNRAMYPIYTIKTAEIPSNLNKRIFKNWIGYNWEA